MNLKEYLDNLNEMVKQDPSLLELTVIYSSDDEGNDYDIVSYAPALGCYEAREFSMGDDIQPDAICIN